MRNVVFCCPQDPLRAELAVELFEELTGSARADVVGEAHGPRHSSSNVPLLVTMGEWRGSGQFAEQIEWPLLDPRYRSTQTSVIELLDRHVRSLVKRNGWEQPT